MNTNRKFHFVVIVALVAILLQSFTSQVSAAQPSDLYAAGKVDCVQVIEEADATLARIDVPDTRAEYAAVERIADCLAVAHASTIPVTGKSPSKFDRFMAVKDGQAELADRSSPAPSSAPATGYFDKDFLQFKLRQVERMSH